jgi:hypothetical protein
MYSQIWEKPLFMDDNDLILDMAQMTRLSKND